MRTKILFICGSINQTSQMHQIARHLSDYDCRFTPYYADGFIETLRRKDYLNFTVLGNKLAERCLRYLEKHNLPLDLHGRTGNYDLVFTCSDLVIPSNISTSKLILVQEGMTDPENLMYRLVKTFNLPRYLASTATTGLSDQYGYFCVASEGYQRLFSRKGVRPEKIRVTGIPNFDNCRQYLQNNFPHTGYVLVATSDMRETLKWENRKRFIKNCLALADGKKLIFKLHPNENFERATREISRWAPDALVYPTGDINHMIANCDVLVTRYSSVVYVGLALEKRVYSDFDLDQLADMTPIQNDANSARLIAEVGRRYIADLPVPKSYEELWGTAQSTAQLQSHEAEQLQSYFLLEEQR
ncbi:MAG: hypothetical protein AB7H80_00165 [Candidatus Kapaibacterium sp.]